MVKYSILHLEHKLKKSLYCQIMGRKGWRLCGSFALLIPEEINSEGNAQH